MTTIRSLEIGVRSLARKLLLLVGCLVVTACGPTGEGGGKTSSASGSNRSETMVTKVPTAGEVTYRRWCISCHLSGVSGSPRLGKVEDWEMRLPKGRNTMLINLKQGIGAMPPRGLCSSCSDEELELSLDYMLDALK